VRRRPPSYARLIPRSSVFLFLPDESQKKEPIGPIPALAERLSRTARGAEPRSAPAKLAAFFSWPT